MSCYIQDKTMGQQLWSLNPFFWVLENFPRAKTHRAANPVPRWQIGGLMRGCQVMIWKTCLWTIVGNMFGECHAPCTLKNSFLDFIEYIKLASFLCTRQLFVS
jgi:hypothetical protein